MQFYLIEFSLIFEMQSKIVTLQKYTALQKYTWFGVK